MKTPPAVGRGQAAARDVVVSRDTRAAVGWLSHWLVAFAGWGAPIGRTTGGWPGGSLVGKKNVVAALVVTLVVAASTASHVTIVGVGDGDGGVHVAARDG